MKLNYKRTILVGLAFLSISAFWQMYDNVIPKILKYDFGMQDGPAGAIMALDNLFALLLLPVFGRLSDRTSTRIGKRMPYILAGTACAVLLTNLMPLTVKAVSLPLFMTILGLLLLAMCTYRSPAVALMPDVTAKPLRSKGNAIINLMGALGGVFTLAAGKFLVVSQNGKEDFSTLFIVVSALMAISVAVLALTVRENAYAEEARQINDAIDDPGVAEQITPGKKGISSLDGDMRKTLYLLLASVALWYMGYNAITSKFSVYLQEMWGKNYSAASTMLMVATIGAVLSYIPVGILSSKIGRKKMIQLGVILLAMAFVIAGLFTAYSPLVYVVFVIVGISWAMINVNSFPMVVEISRSGDIGAFTGYYYAASMAAQIVTPILSGYLMQWFGYQTLMPYAAVMVSIAFITITMTRHGDSIPDAPRSTLESFDTGDD